VLLRKARILSLLKARHMHCGGTADAVEEVPVVCGLTASCAIVQRTTETPVPGIHVPDKICERESAHTANVIIPSAWIDAALPHRVHFVPHFFQ